MGDSDAVCGVTISVSSDQDKPDVLCARTEGPCPHGDPMKGGIPEPCAAWQSGGYKWRPDTLGYVWDPGPDDTPRSQIEHF